MPDETETSSSNEPDPAPARQSLPARLWDSGIPLWQKLLVWAGAAGAAGPTILAAYVLRVAIQGNSDDGLLLFRPEPGSSPFYVWALVILAPSAGLWIWPLSRGRWRTVALVLAFLTTLEFLILLPIPVFFAVAAEGNLGELAVIALLVFVSMLPYPALAVIWTRAIRDFRAARHASPASRED